jgi:hypothetical protein
MMHAALSTRDSRIKPICGCELTRYRLLMQRISWICPEGNRIAFTYCTEYEIALDVASVYVSQDVARNTNIKLALVIRANEYVHACIELDRFFKNIFRKKNSTIQ